MKKSIISILSFALLFLVVGIPSYAKDETVTIDSVTIYASSANITGTTDATAVTIQVRDASGIVSMDTAGTKDGKFTKNVAGSYAVGEAYTIYVADYEGGSWATFTETAIADPQRPATSTPASDDNDYNAGTTSAEAPKAQEPERKKTVKANTPEKTEDDTEETVEKEKTEETTQDISEPVKDTEVTVTEKTETKEPEKPIVAEEQVKEAKKEGNASKILLAIVAVLAACSVVTGIILLVMKKGKSHNIDL